MINFTGKNETTEFELIEDGDYEVTLNAEFKQKFTDPDDVYINCKFAIRTDVEQAFGGRIVFDSIYKTKSTGDYQKSKINGILSAIPDAKLSFEDYDEFVQYINGKNMVITIETELANEFHSKDKNIVKYLSYKPSKVGSTVPKGLEGAVTPIPEEFPF